MVPTIDEKLEHESKLMLNKLKALYEKEKLIVKQIRDLEIVFEQLQADIGLLEDMLEHQFNKKMRIDELQAD